MVNPNHTTAPPQQRRNGKSPKLFDAIEDPDAEDGVMVGNRVSVAVSGREAGVCVKFVVVASVVGWAFNADVDVAVEVIRVGNGIAVESWEPDELTEDG